MNVLVYGSTGSQGSAVVSKLLERNHTPYMLTRHPEKAEAARAQGAKVVIGDLTDRTSLQTASEGMDAVSLLVPFSFPNPVKAIERTKTAIDVAKAAGVKLIVYNTSGMVLPRRVGNPMMDSRVDIIDHLRASGVPFITIQPTVYLENLLGPWTQPELVASDTLAYPIPEGVPTGWIATIDVGALVVAALEHPELAPAQYMVSGVENLTGEALADAFTRGLGRKITYRAMPLEEFGATLDALFGPGAGAGAIQSYGMQQAQPDLFPMWTDMRPVLEALPVRMTSAEDWVRQVAPAFGPTREHLSTV